MRISPFLLYRDTRFPEYGTGCLFGLERDSNFLLEFKDDKCTYINHYDSTNIQYVVLNSEYEEEKSLNLESSEAKKIKDHLKSLNL